MERLKGSLDRNFLSASIVVGAVVLSAVAFNYSGTIHLHIGFDGFQLQVIGKD